MIPMNEKGELLLETEYAKLLNPRTRLVAVTHISNSLGTLNPIKQIIAMAHQVGAKVLAVWCPKCTPCQNRCARSRC